RVRFLARPCPHRVLHSFPPPTLFRSVFSGTRRSWIAVRCRTAITIFCWLTSRACGEPVMRDPAPIFDADQLLPFLAQAGQRGPRSEEHSSELQSRGQLVCRLLLENTT